MTLSRWLKEYLYIPLGGNRFGSLLTYRNLFLTFLLGGIWHGAGWTFIAWGALHGIGCIGHRWWAKLGFRMPALAGWLFTFIYAHVGWVFFRAPTLTEGLSVLKQMFVPEISTMQVKFGEFFLGVFSLKWLNGGDVVGSVIPDYSILWIFIAGCIAFFMNNSNELTLKSENRHPLLSGVGYAFLAICCVLASIQSVDSPFLYFNF